MNRKKKRNNSTWKLVYEKFKPAQEGLREALCTLGNGYFATRGAAPEATASRIHYPGTYIAGVYNKLATYIAGKRVVNEDFVNCPNWLFLTFKIGDGDWITPSTSMALGCYQELNMRGGVLTKKVLFKDNRGRMTRIETQRIVHMAKPHIAALRYVITPENYEGWVVIRTALDGTVQNTGVARYRQLNSMHLKACYLGSFNRNGIFLSVRTSQSDIRISQAAKVRIFSEGREIRPAARVLKEDRKKISQEFRIFVRRRQSYEIEKIVSIYTSRDKGVRNSLTMAINSIEKSRRFGVLLKSHKQAWADLWKKFDIEIQDGAFSQRVLRLHTFHLLQTASPHNTKIDAGLPARGLHGEAYRGHIFWDEVFVKPFFDLHAPEISKALLMYRYRRLPQAREYARENGYRGAMFPWQSGSTGREETQVIHLNPMSGKWGPDHSRIQRHVSFAIAYNVWEYWKRTGDFDFLVRYGVEMILSIAQFASSLTKYDSRDGRYHTDGVMGPDEFHERFPGAPKPGFKDNAYTNLLIVWTLLRAREVLTILPEAYKARLFKKIEFDLRELERWEDITRKMNIIINDDGIISQFDGYFKLKELDWKAYKQKYGNIQRMDRILKNEGKSPNDYKVAKQADVLMIFYLFSLSEIKSLFHRLGYKFNKKMLDKNYSYYVRRTSHGSTLSKVVHCYVAHILGRSKEAWKWFQEVLRSDIYDIQGGTTPEGIHTGVMGGSIYIVMRGFAGIELLDDRVRINPVLPKSWHSIKLSFCYRGIWVSLTVEKGNIRICVYKPTSRRIGSLDRKRIVFPIEVKGRLYNLNFGKVYRIVYKRGV